MFAANLVMDWKLSWKHAYPIILVQQLQLDIMTLFDFVAQDTVANFYIN